MNKRLSIPMTKIQRQSFLCNMVTWYIHIKVRTSTDHDITLSYSAYIWRKGQMCFKYQNCNLLGFTLYQHSSIQTIEESNDSQTSVLIQYSLRLSSPRLFSHKQARQNYLGTSKSTDNES